MDVSIAGVVDIQINRGTGVSYGESPLIIIIISAMMEGFSKGGWWWLKWNDSQINREMWKYIFSRRESPFISGHFVHGPSSSPSYSYRVTMTHGILSQQKWAANGISRV